ncbi:MAG: hypothetical protein NTV01_07020 [Bacteroidia bacterium]|nr:hypothetical protein [Bacteroidia bacterium]
MNIDDLLQGKPRTLENVYALQKADPRCSGLSGKYDAEVSSTVEDALRELNKPVEVKIPKSESKALQMCRDDYLTMELIIEAKKDPRYSDPGQRCPIYCSAIAKAVEELAAAQVKQRQADQGSGRTLLK